MKITENDLRNLIEDEIVAMVERGELDEGILDRLGARAAAVGTKAKSTMKSLGQRGSANVAKLRAKGAAALGGVDAADTKQGKLAQAKSDQAAATQAQGAKDARAIQVKKVVGAKLQKLSRLNTDLTNDVQKLGLGEEEVVVAALNQLENAIVQIATIMQGATKPQKAGAQNRRQQTPEEQAQFQAAMAAKE